MAKITFLGAAGTVTGSKYLIEAEGKRLLVDCGLFEGSKELKQRNWERFPIDTATIDWVLLTHAHIDHTGYLPRLVRDGFRGPIYSNAATQELCGMLLPDSAHLQEEDAEYAAKKGYSAHKPPLRSIPSRNRKRHWSSSAKFRATMPSQSAHSFRFVHTMLGTSWAQHGWN
ncbi:MAG: MBL fold metallo-hydrolase [Candidatus Acidiferrales bacterium]|jgi:metallo-beta-lactamase family protein